MLEHFTGFYGLVASVKLDPDTTIFVAAKDESDLARAVNQLLTDGREFRPDLAKPCIIINPEVFKP